MCVLLYYQVTMPAVENGKYATTVVNGQLLRMSTQTGKFEKCDTNLKSESDK